MAVKGISNHHLGPRSFECLERVAPRGRFRYPNLHEIGFVGREGNTTKLLVRNVLFYFRGEVCLYDLSEGPESTGVEFEFSGKDPAQHLPIYDDIIPGGWNEITRDLPPQESAVLDSAMQRILDAFDVEIMTWCEALEAVPAELLVEITSLASGELNLGDIIETLRSNARIADTILGAHSQWIGESDATRELLLDLQRCRVRSVAQSNLPGIFLDTPQKLIGLFQVIETGLSNALNSAMLHVGSPIAG